MTVSDSAEINDVLVVGAGPAGAAAAILCANKGLSVALLDYRERPRQPARLVWVNAEIRPLLQQCGVDADAVLGQPLGALTYCASDFKKHITAELGSSIAYVTDRAALEDALLDAATAAGVSPHDGARVTALEALEERVRASLENEAEAEARFLIAADGARSGLAQQLGLTGASEPVCWRAQWDAERPRGRAAKTDRAAAEMTVVLGLIEGQGLGYILRSPDHLAAGVAGAAPPGPIGEYFDLFVGEAQDAGLLPADVTPTQPVILPSPAGLAIEREAHVGKRSLLVGEAGGFVAAISHEGIYPGVWSAVIAADVVADAAASDTPQDILGEYDARWRVAMADYLRMPNTDLHFLLPLIFSNQQMADRMAAAFLNGQNI